MAKMFEGAADVDQIDTDSEPVDKPFHFDLAGLAQGLSKTATVASRVNKL